MAFARQPFGHCPSDSANADDRDPHVTFSLLHAQQLRYAEPERNKNEKG
jgi:hypothetical protein